MTKTPAFLETKSHYKILDGLRGVAALLVVIFHTFEAYAGDRFHQIINHGYLAVDFFFLLSGFVIAYAYDDRWGKMTQWEFYKRRLVRLQPMVIVGTIIGALLFYFQASPVFPLIAETPVWKLLLVMLLGFTMLPLPLSLDIRGWQEMHPLDGPAWSLYFEYIGNILYALFVRRFSKTVLAIFVFFSGCMLTHYLLTGNQGDVIGGWALNWPQQYVGLCRMLYPFFGGILLCRMGKLISIKNSFAISSILLVIVFSIPRIGGPDTLWMNGLYESIVIIVVFPLIVAIGAGGSITGKFAGKACKFLGHISYPLYITHYPLIYIYTGWVVREKIPAMQGLWAGILLFVSAVSIAYVSLKLYDEPVREWLRKRFLVKKANQVDN